MVLLTVLKKMFLQSVFGNGCILLKKLVNIKLCAGDNMKQHDHQLKFATICCFNMQLSRGVVFGVVTTNFNQKTHLSQSLKFKNRTSTDVT